MAGKAQNHQAVCIHINAFETEAPELELRLA